VTPIKNWKGFCRKPKPKGFICDSTLFDGNNIVGPYVWCGTSVNGFCSILLGDSIVWGTSVLKGSTIYNCVLINSCLCESTGFKSIFMVNDVVVWSL
jgi:hypothetical protein